RVQMSNIDIDATLSRPFEWKKRHCTHAMAMPTSNGDGVRWTGRQYDGCGERIATTEVCLYITSPAEGQPQLQRGLRLSTPKVFVGGKGHHNVQATLTC